MLVAFLVLTACGFLLSSAKGSWVKTRLAPHVEGSRRTRKRQKGERLARARRPLPRDRAGVRPPAHLAQAAAQARAGRPAAAHGRVRLPDRRLRVRPRLLRSGKRTLVAADPRRASRSAAPSPTCSRLLQGEEPDERLRGPAARPAGHPGRLAQGRPQLQAGHPDDRRRGPRAGQQGARPRPHRHAPRPADGRGALRHRRADRLEELLLRDHRGHDPAAGRRQPRRTVRHGRRHRPPAAAVRAQDQGPDRDGPRLGLRPDRAAVLHRASR